MLTLRRSTPIFPRKLRILDGGQVFVSLLPRDLLGTLVVVVVIQPLFS